MFNTFINVKWYSWGTKFSFANYFCFITLRRATKRKLDILKVKGSRRCLPKGEPAIAFRERYAHLHCVTSPLSVSLYVLQSRCALHVVISFEFFFCAFHFLSPPRWLSLSILIPVAFACALRPFLTLLSPHVLTSNIEGAPQRRYWLSGHAKAHPDFLTTKFY